MIAARKKKEEEKDPPKVGSFYYRQVAGWTNTPQITHTHTPEFSWVSHIKPSQRSINSCQIAKQAKQQVASINFKL